MAELKNLKIDYNPFQDIVTIEGVKYAGEIFRSMAFPRTDCLYHFERHGDEVHVQVIQPIGATPVITDGETVTVPNENKNVS